MRQKVIVGTIVFILFYALTIIYLIHSKIDYANANDYAQLHLLKSIMKLLTTLNPFGLLFGSIATGIYCYNLFLAWVFKNLNSKLSRIILSVILFVIYTINFILVYSCAVIMSSIGILVIFLISYTIMLGFHAFFIVLAYLKNQSR